MNTNINTKIATATYKLGQKVELLGILSQVEWCAENGVDLIRFEIDLNLDEDEPSRRPYKRVRFDVIAEAVDIDAAFNKVGHKVTFPLTIERITRTYFKHTKEVSNTYHFGRYWECSDNNSGHPYIYLNEGEMEHHIIPGSVALFVRESIESSEPIDILDFVIKDKSIKFDSYFIDSARERYRYRNV